MSYPMPPTQQYTPSEMDGIQLRQDREHLNLLAIFYYIMGGLSILGVLFMALYFGLIGAVVANAPPDAATSAQDAQAARAIGGALAGFGTVIVLASAAFAALTIYAGRCLQTYKNAGLIYVMAALHCLNVPLGTALGVFTFIVMSRPTVKALFSGAMDYTAPRGY